MKKSLILLAVFALTAGAASAQSAPSPTPAPMQRPLRGDRMSTLTPDQRADQQARHLTRQLGLSADQTAKVKQLALSQQQERQAMRGQASTPADRQARRQNMQAARGQYEEQLKGILTSDQYTRYTQLRDQRMDKMQDRRAERKGKKGHVKASTNS